MDMRLIDPVMVFASYFGLVHPIGIDIVPKGLEDVSKYPNLVSGSFTILSASAFYHSHYLERLSSLACSP
jgi:hypothetical protein